jgi:hypothetical protein
MQKEIGPIIQLFPDFKQKIDFLFQTDENFRDLCEDYLLCVGNALTLKRDTNNSKEQIEEFEEIQLSLEQEILERITQIKNC